MLKQAEISYTTAKIIIAGICEVKIKQLCNFIVQVKRVFSIVLYIVNVAQPFS